jgi:hypothetical protein
MSGIGPKAEVDEAPLYWVLTLVVQIVFRLRGLLGFFGISSKLSPVDGGGQRYVAVCVRERELGQMIALSRTPVAVGCCFYGDGCVHDSASLLVPGLVPKDSNQSAT